MQLVVVLGARLQVCLSMMNISTGLVLDVLLNSIGFAA